MTENKKCIKCGRTCSGNLYNIISKEPWKIEYPVCFACYELTLGDIAWLKATGSYGQ